MPKNKKITFQIIPSGHIHGETYCNIHHGNADITFTSETKKTVQSNLKAVRSMIKAIHEGRVKIVELDLNGEVKKEFKS